MRKFAVHGITLSLISLVLTLACLELALRIFHGAVFRFDSLTAESPTRPGSERFEYHAKLGWVQKVGRFHDGWTANVDASGLRSNGGTVSFAGRPVLVVGDSFAFGDEVEDHETWSAYLERLLDKRVLNAGVGAYGVDQAFLRAELLLEQYQPDVVILSFISDDITRTEFAAYPWGKGWKPYFELVNGALTLRNVPVPEGIAPPRFPGARQVLGYSYLAKFVFSRAAPRWWLGLPSLQRVHNDGDDVSVALLTRLDGLARARGAQFVAVALSDSGRIADDPRLPSVIKRVKENGIEILDLSAETTKFQPDKLQKLIRPRGHYGPAMNTWVAERIAAVLKEKGAAKRRGRLPEGLPEAAPTESALPDVRAKVH